MKRISFPTAKIPIHKPSLVKFFGHNNIFIIRQKYCIKPTVFLDQETYLELQCCLTDFNSPNVCDAKMGVRTFLETEVSRLKNLYNYNIVHKNATSTMNTSAWRGGEPICQHHFLSQSNL